jgi:hypothetical protein
MPENLHEHVAVVVSENPHLAGAFDWSKMIQVIEMAIPVIMQIISLFHTPAPTPVPTPTPTPTPTPSH